MYDEITSFFRPYTPSGGAVSCVWFDRKQISPFVPEDTETMEDACQTIGEIIDQEELNGIPRSRIVLGNGNHLEYSHSTKAFLYVICM